MESIQLGPVSPARPPNIQALKKYNVNRVGNIEVIWQPTYEYQTYPTTGQTQLTFFQNPVGAVAGGLSTTNVRSAGQFPRPQEFLITGIQVTFEVGAVVAQAVAAVQSNAQDVFDVSNSGNLELFIGSKIYDEQSWKDLIKGMKAEYKETNKVFFNAYNIEHLDKLIELVNATYDREINGEKEDDGPDIQEPLTDDAARLMDNCNDAFIEMDKEAVHDVDELKGIAEEIYNIPTEGKKYTEWIGSLSIRLRNEVKEFKKNPPIDDSDLPF